MTRSVPGGCRSREGRTAARPDRRNGHQPLDGRDRPGDWRKAGPARVASPFAEIVERNGHKFWVVMDPLAVNRAARIRGRYWGLFIVGLNKHVYAAWAESWEPLGPSSRSPSSGRDKRMEQWMGRHCDTPTAYWMAQRGEVLIFCKAYPREPQKHQPRVPFGSSSVVAWRRPSEPLARKADAILAPGRSDTAFTRGWVGGFQLLRDRKQGLWYALLNGSPTAPEDDSHREPAPSLGGWAVCSSQNPDSGWSIPDSGSPFVTPASLTAVSGKRASA